MGTGNTLRIITIVLTVIALMSLTAFATYGEPPIGAYDEPSAEAGISAPDSVE